MRLAGKVALVTGAGQGMGRAIARLFAQEGAAVAAIDLNLAAAQETIAGIPAATGCSAHAVNVTDSASVREAFDALVAQHGRIDIVVANAGTGAVDSLAGTSDESWARVIGVNLTGAFHVCREAARTMTAAGVRGSIIQVSSTAALNGDGPAHYCASKAGVMGLTRSAARELAPAGIRVNTIVPGPTNTPMMQGIPDEWAQAIVKAVPLGRMGEPDEVARLALFLAGDDSSFITGQNLAVNGGLAFI
ncbi:3-oxoacyl-ACP reductase [Cupriavidus necator]|uniref:3-oxoacyl-ACP reductase n=1 Tax=Cupriavidus necator TaxID=106590 RepID=A0A1U9V0A6_CUPNE|nr:SDR family NAD(P)-dependent oxidoreductase [Cupriavidus necator]AQV98249.1 3-oxoacyl-ACP reductase [Cupriavidus necator]